MKIKIWTAMLLLHSALPLAHAQTVANVKDVFPFAAQSHSTSGKIEMDEGARITGTREVSKVSGYLDFYHGDNLSEGKCDNKKCQLNKVVGPKITLPNYQSDLVEFPSAFKASSSSRELKCDKKNQSESNSNSIFKTIQIEKQCEITLTNTAGDILVKDLKIKDGGFLTIQNGNYWIENFEIDGGRLNIVGDKANFYVSGNAKIKNAGTIAGLHVYAINKDIKLENSTFTGSLKTNYKLEIDGKNSKVQGEIAADELDLEGQLILTAGNYHFHDVELEDKAKLETQGTVTLYIESELDLGENSTLGNESQSVIVYVHGKENKRGKTKKDDDDADEGEVDLDKGARLYGFVYVEGELELDEGAGIYGAVNVIDLDMDEKSFIDYSDYLSAESVDGVHHYELHYSSCSADSPTLTVKACVNESCTLLYKQTAKLHIKGGNSNIANFNNFTGSETASINKGTLKYPFTMEVQSNGNGGNMDPKPSSSLVCYVDGIKTCTVISSDNTSNNSPLTLKIDTTYAADDAPLSLSGSCTAQAADIETKFSFDASTSQSKEPLTLSLPNGFVSLKPGESKILMLPINGASVSYPHADLLTISIQQKKADGSYGVAITDQVAFVPKRWQVQNPVICSDSSGFDYLRDTETCTVLAAVGNDVRVGVLALDINDQPLPLNWLKNKVGNNNSLFQAVIEHPHTSIKGKVTTLSSITDNGESSSVSKHTLKSDSVGAVKVSLGEWVATYIPAGDSSLRTLGEEKYIGRTVPAYLRITGMSGEVANGVAYRSKNIDFAKEPYFKIKGCAASATCSTLASFSGEFAKGLAIATNLEFSASDNELVITENPSSEIIFDKAAMDTESSQPGTHFIKLNEPLYFTKNEKRPAQDITQALILAINVAADEVSTPNGTAPMGNGEARLDARLGEKNAKLRYGFLSIDKLDLSVNTAGDMPVHLNYYGSNTDSIEQDIRTNTAIETSHSIFSLTPDSGVATAKPTGLEFKEQTIEGKLVKVIKVPAHSLEWRGKVEMEVDKWLKPYDEQMNKLVNPSGTLNIVDDARKRGNDRIFNRREVVR